MARESESINARQLQFTMLKGSQYAQVHDLIVLPLKDFHYYSYSFSFLCNHNGGREPDHQLKTGTSAARRIALQHQLPHFLATHTIQNILNITYLYYKRSSLYVTRISQPGTCRSSDTLPRDKELFSLIAAHGANNFFDTLRVRTNLCVIAQLEHRKLNSTGSAIEDCNNQELCRRLDSRKGYLQILREKNR